MIEFSFLSTKPKGPGAFTLKMHQMFSVYTTPEKFENATFIGHLGKSQVVTSSFSKSSDF